MHARASDPMWCTLSDDWRPPLPRRLENASRWPVGLHIGPPNPGRRDTIQRPRPLSDTRRPLQLIPFARAWGRAGNLSSWATRILYKEFASRYSVPELANPDSKLGVPPRGNHIGPLLDQVGQLVILIYQR